MDGAPGEGVQPEPRTVGEAGRLACEAYAQAYHHQFGLRTISLRFGRAYGVIHLRDLVDGLVRAASRPDTTPAKHLLAWEAATPSLVGHDLRSRSPG